MGGDGKSSRKPMTSLIAGGFAGTVSSTLVNPLDVVKTKLQSGGDPRVSAHHPWRAVAMARYVAANEGVRGFFRGLGPTLVGVFPARATYFGAYDSMKRFLGPRFGDCSPVHMASAATAGLVSYTVTNPIWMVRTRLQLDAGLTKTSGLGYTRNVEAIGKIMREEGPGGFFRGLRASYWGISESAIHFVLYERLKRFVSERNRAADPDSDGRLGPFQYIYSAAICKLTASSLTYPHEVIRTRMRQPPDPKTKKIRYVSVIETLKQVAREEGRGGLYAGLSAHLLKTIPSTAILFLVYEKSMRWLNHEDGV